MEYAVQQLLDMLAVHRFFVALLQDKLGFEPPVPAKVERILQAPIDIQQESGEELSRWLAVLDLAITPMMVRDALRVDSTGSDAAEALLRYFYRKRSNAEIDRDKLDFVITFLLRRFSMPIRSGDEWALDKASPFEEYLCATLNLSLSPDLPEEHRQLLREFPFVRAEAEEFEHFDKLMDSGILQRVRDIKLRFGDSLYHPRVLSLVAEYNVYIGNRFDELFREAARSIKQFALSLQQAGRSIMSRIEGDVTVEHLATVEEDHILHKEYGRAQEQLRTVSNFKKVVDRRKRHTVVAPLRGTLPLSGAAAGAQGGGSAADIGKSLDRTAEEARVEAMLETIRNFVHAADARSANIFPMRNGNLPLSPAEVEAFRADFRGEKSFRGDFASALTAAVSIYARMVIESESLKQRQSSAYLWKPHADSLTFLIERASRLQRDSAIIEATAQKRGLVDKVKALESSLGRLQQQSSAVAELLQTVSSAG